MEPMTEIAHLVPVPHHAMQDAGLCPPDCGLCAAEPEPAVRPRLTLRQRLRATRARMRWWVHDRLFPDCEQDPDE